MIKTVMIVDDDLEMLEALKNGFDKYKDTFSVVTAADGKSAIELLSQSTISLVVTDLKMPNIDGFGVLQHIMENYPDIPVIVITGYSTPEMEKMAHEGGAVGYIAKPFMLDGLARKIMGTLRKESEGGTLHSVSSGIFLQLMEMEQKTCTIRLEDKSSGKKGVLFFRDGELLDARVNELQGKDAAHTIFSWETVTISIQNVCPPIANRIQSDLQPLILEASRLKDESEDAKQSAGDDEEVISGPAASETAAATATHPIEPLNKIRLALEKHLGSNTGVEDIYHDERWKTMAHELTGIGDTFGLGALKLFYIDTGEPLDFIVLPIKKTTVLSIKPKSPRDKIMSTLNKFVK